ncbi:MAG: class IV adenylate cyclase [Planctomycetaceae bacterium]
MYEVELKFRVADAAAVERQLADLGAPFAAAEEQVDRYFAHPARDFAATDEALRLRRVGDHAALTWKGPRLDATTKTRREIELPLAIPADGATAIARWTDLLEALGFRPVREVAKRRRIAVVHRDGHEIEVALDHVAGLGDFLEIELWSAEEGLDAARRHVEALARELGCGAPERRSYLELLLATD